MIQKNTKKTVNKKIHENLKYLDRKCAGIDIGADFIHVCALNDSNQQEVREYPVFTQDLHNMADWLDKQGVKSVAMESTGVYWIPVFEILEQRGFTVLLVNPHHFKSVPARKTDIKDAQWIQQLHSSGLLGGSFRPSDEYIQLRGIVRQRSELFKESARQIHHMHKALTQMNIQLRIAFADIVGKTGLAIIKAIIAGERDPKKLVELRDSRCKKSKAEIIKALEGNWREEHILVLKQSHESYEFFHSQIQECEQKIEKILAKLPPIKAIEIPKNERYIPPKDPFAEYRAKVPAKKRGKKPEPKSEYRRSPYYFDLTVPLKTIYGVDLTEIPGIQGNTAMVILSEIGTDMSKWKNKKYFSSWLSLCPGNKKSGGKILSSRTKPSDNRVAQALRMSANAVRNTETALGAYFRRMRAKFGPAKAITATAHKLAIIIYTMIKHQKSYIEIGAEYYEAMYTERICNTLKKKADKMGYMLVAKEQIA